ncbi:MAG: diaminopimelate dehydrogenase, partial [Peptococcaceae bacterium]|nr:diaminopimelate dehydrogenase [Peptococcaceae bacterium]
MTIRIGILGYGNLGRGVELAIQHCPDMELAGVFTRRNPQSLQTVTGANVYSMEQAETMQNEIDVMILCGGSATDLPVQTPKFAQLYNVIDSFDTHAKIPEHFDAVDAAAKAAGKTAIISTGWDPGMFSLNRVLAQAILPQGDTYTFWGKGVSQGHSDAIRRLDGVKDARQYTIPVETALEAVRNGEAPNLTTRQKHLRECFVVAEEGADLAKIEQEIVTMPNYFADYDTT